MNKLQYYIGLPFYYIFSTMERLDKKVNKLWFRFVLMIAFMIPFCSVIYIADENGYFFSTTLVIWLMMYCAKYTTKVKDEV